MQTEKPYNSYSSSLEKKYGYRIWRVGIDAGFTCPHRGEDRSGGCVFCDSQGAKAAYVRSSESCFTRKSCFEKDIDTLKCPVYVETDIESQIEKSKTFLKNRYKAEHFAAYFQSFSNTYAPVEKLKQVYDSVFENNSWDMLIVSTRPDCIDKEKCDLLASYKSRVKTVCVELGLQSGDDEILRKMNRGHNVQSVKDAAKLIKAAGLELCLHIMIGFPGEGQKEVDKTISVINEIHPDSIKIHNLNICASTALFDRYLEGEVTAPCVKRCIFVSIYVLRRIFSDIVIERFLCETPSHRLAAPRTFLDKNSYLIALENKMNEIGAVQGDLHRGV